MAASGGADGGGGRMISAGYEIDEVRSLDVGAMADLRMMVIKATRLPPCAGPEAAWAAGVG